MSLVNMFLEEGTKQAAMSAGNPQVYIECLVKFDSMRGVMYEVYKALVYNGKILPVEKMPVSDQKDIWNQTREIASGRLNKEQAVKLSKALVALNYFL